MATDTDSPAAVPSRPQGPGTGAPQGGTTAGTAPSTTTGGPWGPEARGGPAGPRPPRSRGRGGGGGKGGNGRGAGRGDGEPADSDARWGRVTTPRTLLSRALSVPLALGFTVFLPLTVAVQSGAGAKDGAFYLQLALTMYAGARLSSMVLTSRRKLLQGSYWLFVYMAMGVAPLAQAVLGQVPTPVVGPRTDLTSAIALVLLGCICFDVGSLLARHRPSGKAQGGRAEPKPVFVHKRRLQLLTVFAFLCSGVFVMKLGGPAVFFSSRQEIIAGIAEAGVSADDGQAGQAFLRGFGTVPALLALLVYTRWMVTSTRARRMPSVIATWAALAALNLVVNNPISNPRYWFLTVMFALLFTVFPVSAAMYRVALSMGVVVALIIFPFADRFRYDEKNYKPVETTSVLEPMALKDYDQVGMFANTITFVESGSGHFYGRQLAGSVFFAVPRSVWPGKPRDTGVMVGQWMGTVNTNLSSPIWAELWIDFGPVGMGGGLLAMGYVASRVDRRYAKRATRRSPPGSLISVVVPLVAGYSFILLRGPLLQASGRVAIAMLCLAAIATYRTDRRTSLR